MAWLIFVLGIGMSFSSAQAVGSISPTIGARGLCLNYVKRSLQRGGSV